MGDHQQGGGGAFEISFEPFDHIEVEVVGGLVKQEKIGVADEHLGQSQPFLLSARQLPDPGFQVGDLQAREDLFHLRFGIPGSQVLHLFRETGNLPLVVVQQSQLVLPDHPELLTVGGENLLPYGVRGIQPGRLFQVT